MTPPLRPLSAFLVVALLCDGAQAAPSAGEHPARARVAAQCAAFWDGAGRPDRAHAFLALSVASGATRTEAAAWVDRLRPDMERLAADRAVSARAAALWRDHAALCGGAVTRQRPERRPQ
mgnify:FL=1